MNKRFWLVLGFLVALISGYYLNKNLSLTAYYEDEFWLIYSRPVDNFEEKLQKIESDMRSDGYDGRQIKSTRVRGAIMASER